MSVTVDLYSDKAIVVRNALEHHGPILQGMNGMFNDRLKGGRGWIFPKYMLSQVRSVVEKLNSGQYGNEFEQKKVEKNSDGVEMVSKQEYLSLLSRVERLEALFSHHKDLIISSVKKDESKEEVKVDSSEEVTVDFEEEEPKKMTKPVRVVRMDDDDDELDIVAGSDGPEVVPKRVSLMKPKKK
jgi:hypothetical protein